MASYSVTDNLIEEERRNRYLAIPEDIRRQFERDEMRKSFFELDQCHGACHLRRGDISYIVAQALRFHDGKRLRCGDYVIMPNHVHWLILPLPGHNLEDILHSVKGWSGREINGSLKRRGRLWQKESFDHIVRDPEEFDRIRTYIRDNPAKANLKTGMFRYYRADWC